MYCSGTYIPRRLHLRVQDLNPGVRRVHPPPDGEQVEVCQPEEADSEPAGQRTGQPAAEVEVLPGDGVDLLRGGQRRVDGHRAGAGLHESVPTLTEAPLRTGVQGRRGGGGDCHVGGGVVPAAAGCRRLLLLLLLRLRPKAVLEGRREEEEEEERGEQVCHHDHGAW